LWLVEYLHLLPTRNTLAPTDRHRNARKARKTRRFSKDWEAHAALTAFTLFSANSYRPIRTGLRRSAQSAGSRAPRRLPA
jgi:hypothetical protein